MSTKSKGIRPPPSCGLQKRNIFRNMILLKGIPNLNGKPYISSHTQLLCLVLDFLKIYPPSNSTLNSLQLLTKLFLLTEQKRTTYLFWKISVTLKKTQSAPPISSMTIAEVFNALVHLKLTETHGLNDTDGKILKLSAPVICDTLTYIQSLYRAMSYAGCFQTGQGYSSI